MDLSVKLIRVYKENAEGNLENMGIVETERYQVSAEELGTAYGEGTFLTYEETSDNVSHKNGSHIHGYWKVISMTSYFSESWDDDDDASEDTNGS